MTTDRDRDHRLIPVTGVGGAVVLALGLTAVLAPNGLPGGVVLLGMMLGALSSLLSMGLVLIYRANRFINFAHGPMGLIAGVATALAVVELGWSFWVALPVGIAGGAVVGGITERLAISRFRDAPRIIVTVATIGLAQIYTAIQALIPILAGNVAPNYDVPLGWSFDAFPVFFGGSYLFAALIVPACMLALAWFLGRTRYGIAVRALASNEDRAQNLGVPARNVSLLVWMVAGALAAVGGILSIPVFGYALEGTGQGPGVFLLALAAAVIGGMRSLPITFFASIGLGVAYQAVFWNTSRSSLTDVATLLIIAVAVFLRVDEGGRAASARAASTWALLAPVRPLPRWVLGHPRVRHGLGLSAAVVAAVVIVGPQLLQPSQAQLVGAIVVFAMAAMSLAVVSGLLGRVSLGHWAVVGVGALAGSWGYDVAGFLGGLVTSVVGAVAASLLIGVPSLRLSGLFYAVTTLAFAVPAQTFLFKSSFSGEPVTPPSLFGLAIDSQNRLLYLAAVLFGIVVFVVGNLRRSTWGRSLIAIREDERTARSHGIRPARAVLTAYAVSGVIAGLAGYLYLFNQRILDSDTFDAERSLILLAMVVVGGLGSFVGAVVGAVAIQASTFFLDGNYQLLGTGAGMLIVLLFLPSGLGSILYKGRDWLVERLTRESEPQQAGDVQVAAPSEVGT